jgi:hypothetical protein
LPCDDPEPGFAFEPVFGDLVAGAAALTLAVGVESGLGEPVVAPVGRTIA